MTVYRAQLGVHLDGQLPRDVMSITPHFDDHGISSDPQGLAEDLATGYAAYLQGTKHVTCEMYEAEGPPPHYPVGEAVANNGQAANSSCPREVALCLSFFSERNVPRRRGRLYVPMAAVGLSVASVRPAGPTMVKVGELATLFMDLGGLDVDWVVWSRVDKIARPVTDWWVDDEWDTVRSRGLRPSTRIVGTTSEAQASVPWPAYSERILSSSGHVGWQFTTVPVGRRVVVKHVAVSKFNAVSTYLQVAIAAAAVWSRSLPGDLAGFQDAVMWVAYGGEQVGIYMDGINAGVALAGYVFDDLAGARAELDPVEAQLAAAAGAEDLGPWSM